MSYLDDIEKGGYKPPKDSDDPDEDFDEENTWRSVFIGLGKVVLSVILVFSVFYIYGGVREFFMFQETSEAINQEEIPVVAGNTEMVLPLRVIILRNESNGSERDRASVERLVDGADNIWHQANIALRIDTVEEREVRDDIINNVVSNPRSFLEEAEHDTRFVNVFLSRRLQGINGIAFSGSNSLVVADLTTNYDFRVLAHEIGHVLGLDHIEVDKNRLMNKGSNGYIITKEEAREARRGVNLILN